MNLRNKNTPYSGQNYKAEKEYIKKLAQSVLARSGRNEESARVAHY